MTETGQPGMDDRAHHLGGLGLARVCCAVVVLLLVAAIVYGAIVTIDNYTQIAV
jgi:hypothetical protein